MELMHFINPIKITFSQVNTYQQIQTMYLCSSETCAVEKLQRLKPIHDNIYLYTIITLKSVREFGL
jgi:hypothetical protein